MLIDTTLIPPIGAVSQAERMFRVNWVAALDRSPSGVPLLSCDFVARQGPRVRLIDIREPDELTGPLGHIPGVDWLSREALAALPQRLGRDEAVVIISRGGERAAAAAQELERAGLRFVAALFGGMLTWRAFGYGTSRDPQILGLREQLRPQPPELPGGRRLRAADIEAHIGEPRSVRFVKLAALLLHGGQSCVDGRDDSGVIGTPGGDAGEFLLALAALERLTGPVPAAALPELLRRRLDTFGPLIMHGDIASGNALIKALRADRRFDDALRGISEALQWRRFLSDPPAELHEALLEHLVQPAHIGCGHLRLSLQRGQDYGARPELVLDFLRTFYRARWAGAADPQFVVLPGGHEEGAVVNVRVPGPLHAYTRIPLVSPSCAGTQMFVNHPQVSEYLRADLCQFLCEQPGLLPLPAGGVEALRGEIAALAARQLGHTLGALARGLPIFDVLFESERSVVVREAGEVR